MNSATTRVIRIESHGPPEVLVERQIPLPAPGPGEVHVRVEASGVNFADLVMRQGLYGSAPPRPYSPGFEVAGTIASAGSGVHDWPPGARVVALMRYGGYARDVLVPTRNLFRYPESLTPVQAAAIPVNFLTAWFCLFESARAREGETVLILGAAGGVGTAAVQLAVAHGLRVIGAAGAREKLAFVTDELGAVACVDSHGDWETEVRDLVGERGIDVALDPLGGRATASCRRLLAPLGRLVFYGLSQAAPGKRANWLRAAWAWLRTPRFHPLSFVEPNVGVLGVHLLHLDEKEHMLRPALEEIFRAVEAGAVRPIVDRAFNLDRGGAVEAHKYIHAHRNIGKIVLKA
jgi:NADPH:quinone reductase-like Zn-dependent oxidoreductase